MQTSHLNHAKIFVLLFTVLFTLSAQAQLSKDREVVIHLDTVAVMSTQHAFKSMVSKIVSNGNFSYRKTLRQAKLTNNNFQFDNFQISEVELLKQFKKAARKSESVEEFESYFLARDLDFLELLEDYIVAGLYMNVRKTTFNGFLDAWQSYY